MTKKDYKLIAQAIADTWCDFEAQKLISENLAEALALDNPRFDRDKFLQACGVETQTTEQYANEHGLTLNRETNTYYDDQGHEYRDENGQAVFGS